MSTNEQLENVKKLYEQSKSFVDAPKPKHTFMSVKCPKCGNKLKKSTVQHPIYAEEGGTEFGNIVAQEMKSGPGLYNLIIEQFNCGCGYEYISCRLDQQEL